MGWAYGYRNLVFYVDYGRIAGRYHEWVQDELIGTVAMFCRIGIDAILEKTKAMVCTHGLIREKWGETAYKQQAMGEGEIFRERKKTQVSCTKCGVMVAASYIRAHMARIHVICVPQRGGSMRWG